MREFSCLEDAPSNVVRLPSCKAQTVVATLLDPRRRDLEAFISGRFDQAYGAQVTVDHPFIAGLLAPDGGVLAAAGVRFAASGPLFVERYLDAPIEATLSRALGGVVSREDVTEIGAFASTHPAWSMQLFEALPPWLAGPAGQRFAVATLRPELARLLGRSGFGLHAVADADPARLGGEAAAWGSYYAGAPRIYAGRIGAADALSQMRERLRTRSMERHARRVARASA